jgi:hypothetical protein
LAADRSGIATLEQLRANLEAVQRRIRAASERAGRDPAAVRLVAVTKAFPPETVRLAAQAGLTRIGENRVEEALPKRQALADRPDLEWHLIGHLQSRKAPLVPGAFHLVHSVDRLKIARALDQRAGAAGQRLPILLQCNVSGEASKGGWQLADKTTWPAALAELAQISGLPHLQVLGLMTIAPLSDDPQAARPTFRKLRTLADFLRERTGHDLPELSMGMTDDFEVAVEEGATLLRIGRALFGPRPSG